ncbi:MAG: pseudouridine synthase [Bacteroidota bacterium]|nr:pseudouridine synthase [Bacteroidota bacterium]
MNYYIIYKPYKMISQFTSSHKKKKCLGELGFPFPKDVYPVGRLDENSEGLLILTNDKSLNFKLLNPEFEHKRIYLVQLQGLITDEALKQLEAGVTIALDAGPYLTRPCKVKQVKKPENLPPRGHPISDRLPTSWIELTLTEGKFHQVRKMTAGVGFPCIRLIRIAIEDIRIEQMQPGEIRELKKEAVYKRLRLENQ